MAADSQLVLFGVIHHTEGALGMIFGSLDVMAPLNIRYARTELHQKFCYLGASSIVNHTVQRRKRSFS